VLENFAAARLGMLVQEMDFENGLGKRIGWSDVLALARRAGATPQQLAKLATIERRGPGGLVGLYRWKLGQHGSESRNRNVFRPFVDNWRHKLNIIRKNPSKIDDLMWLDRMTAAWRVCLSGQIDGEKAAEAAAAICGEREHFDAVMRPVLREHARQRIAGLKQVEASPEYFTNLIGRTVPRG
jgi:hypothetical protein